MPTQGTLRVARRHERARAVGCVGWDGVRQWAHLAIDLDTDRGRELVPLLGGGVERTEPELDLQKGRVRSDGRW